MSENQTEFKGWAKVEVMGHQSHVGYVETQAFGAAVLFRIDQSAMPAVKETLQASRWIDDVLVGAGSEVEHAEIPAASVLVGAGSIYRIIPCDEATAKIAIRQGVRRPLIVLKLAGKQLTAGDLADEQVDYNDEDNDPDNYVAGAF